MSSLLKPTLLAFIALTGMLNLYAQNTKDSVPEKFIFSKIIDLPATSVKDQHASGTCWSYAATSFIESELLRISGDTCDLSEMFFVRKAYKAKAMQYIRLHGTANFGQGGQAHDVMKAVATQGMISENTYSGLANGQTKPSHAELEAVLTAVVQAVSKNPGGKLSPQWNEVIDAVLDVYMGKVPSVLGTSNLSPLEFAKQINPDDYVEITSFTHHPYYIAFPLEIPDNWSNDIYYNIPLNELIAIIDYSLSKGFTVVWDGDVSDKGFSHKKGVAVLPEADLSNMEQTERSKWEKLSDKERQQQLFLFEKPVPEKTVTPEMRQAAFDNYSATDDHLMHITGTVTDQNGKRYFRTKNSWSAESNSEGGYLNMSEAYLRLNTIAIMVHKDAVPKEIRKKAGIR